jgi:hypothetical protein
MARVRCIGGPLVASIFLLLTSSERYPLLAADRFRRADSNADGRLDITDAIHSLDHLFRGSPAELCCQDAADVNDDGDVDVSDPVLTLLYLFRGAVAPPPPCGNSSSDCGEDPSADTLGRERYSPCPPLPPATPMLGAPRSPIRDPSVELRGTAGPGFVSAGESFASAAGRRLAVTGDVRHGSSR